jgi:hypothetical protein
MARPIRSKDGTFAGSVGDGKTRVPTPAQRSQAIRRRCSNCAEPTSDYIVRRLDIGEIEFYCGACEDDETQISASLAHASNAWRQRQTRLTTTDAPETPSAPTTPDTAGLPYGPFSETRARLALTMGECHNLAIAVHRQTGWPLIAFSPWHEEEPGTTGVLTHVAVLSPDEYVLDGHGATELDWAQHQSEQDGQVLKDESELHQWLVRDTDANVSEWLPIRPDAFTGYVPAVLAEYEQAKAQ